MEKKARFVSTKDAVGGQLAMVVAERRVSRVGGRGGGGGHGNGLSRAGVEGAGAACVVGGETAGLTVEGAAVAAVDGVRREENGGDGVKGRVGAEVGDKGLAVRMPSGTRAGGDGAAVAAFRGGGLGVGVGWGVAYGGVARR